MSITVEDYAKKKGIESAEVLEKASKIDPDISTNTCELDDDVIDYLDDAFEEILKERKAVERARKAAEKKKALEKKGIEAAAKKADNRRQVADFTEASTGVDEFVPSVEEPTPVSGEPQALSQDTPAPVTVHARQANSGPHISIRDEVGPGLHIVKSAAEAGGTPVKDYRRKTTLASIRKKAEEKKEQQPPVPLSGEAALLRESALRLKVKVEDEDEAGNPIIDLKDEQRKTGVHTFLMRRNSVEDVTEQILEDQEREQLRQGTARHSTAATPHSQEGSDHQRAGMRTWRRPPSRPKRRRGGRPTVRVKTEEEILQELSGTTLEVPMPATVKDLSRILGVKSQRLISSLMKNNILVTLNDPLPTEHVELLGMELNIEFKPVKQLDVEESFMLERPGDQPEHLQLRAPVAAVLGHVDHGKTSLLDKIRTAAVAEGESGGITQHIGAYKVSTSHGHVVFLDTPGHQAFSAMRSRGANVTDIVVLVVAADDGIMPQTDESIDHARAAGVPIMVAINKIDKPNADVMRIKGELAKRELVPEDWGGSTIVCELSALTGQGVDHLLEMLALQAQILELKANPDKDAVGTVLESELTEDRGVVVKTLVQEGTLKKGDLVLCGATFGKVKALYNDHGRAVNSAGPSTPVEIAGLSEIPRAGDKFYVMNDIQKARQIAELRKSSLRAREILEKRHITLENLFQRMQEDKVQEIRVVVKADVAGSLEVLKKSITEQSTGEIKVRILHGGIGGITESDVLLADASDAVILGFHVVPESKARKLAEERGVEIKLYQVIYEMLDELRAAMEGMLAPEAREKPLGHLIVRQVFRISRVGNIAGCFVSDGVVRRDSFVRVIRDNVVIYPPAEKAAQGAKLSSLKRFKDDVKDVREGMECGVSIDGFDDIQSGDVLEVFEVELIKRKLES